MPPMRFVVNRVYSVFRCFTLKNGQPGHPWHPHARNPREICFGTFSETVVTNGDPEVWVKTLLGALRKWRQVYNPGR